MTLEEPAASIFRAGWRHQMPPKLQQLLIYQTNKIRRQYPYSHCCENTSYHSTAVITTDHIPFNTSTFTSTCLLPHLLSATKIHKYHIMQHIS